MLENTSDGVAERFPHRELSDPRALRAVAHPVRLALLEQLVLHGPSTATELAERLMDQSPANCSWHLRQLARYGFIEEAGSGPGRQRRWRAVIESTSIGSDDAAPELAVAADAFDDVLLDRALAVRRAWKESRRAEPKRWRDAAFGGHSWAWLTADETAELRNELSAVVERWMCVARDRFDPANRHPGSRPVQLIAWLVPGGPEVPGEDDEHEETP
jgi:DNA-binding transcriptional ArsR family regulator